MVYYKYTVEDFLNAYHAWRLAPPGARDKEWYRYTDCRDKLPPGSSEARKFIPENNCFRRTPKDYKKWPN